jgi:hypothetical protein
MTNATRSTALPANFYAVTGAELDAAVAVVRECRAGETVLVFGVECVCVRRGWFQRVGALKHELRSANMVRLLAAMPSVRQEALIARAAAVAADMFEGPENAGRLANLLA